MSSWCITDNQPFFCSRSLSLFLSLSFSLSLLSSPLPLPLCVRACLSYLISSLLMHIYPYTNPWKRLKWPSVIITPSERQLSDPLFFHPSVEWCRSWCWVSFLKPSVRSTTINSTQHFSHSFWIHCWSLSVFIFPNSTLLFYSHPLFLLMLWAGTTEKAKGAHSSKSSRHKVNQSTMNNVMRICTSAVLVNNSTIMECVKRCHHSAVAWSNVLTTASICWSL